jgi:hypothetical protein
MFWVAAVCLLAGGAREGVCDEDLDEEVGWLWFGGYGSTALAGLYLMLMCLLGRHLSCVAYVASVPTPARPQLPMLNTPPPPPPSQTLPQLHVFLHVGPCRRALSSPDTTPLP